MITPDVQLWIAGALAPRNHPFLHERLYADVEGSSRSGGSETHLSCHPRAHPRSAPSPTHPRTESFPAPSPGAARAPYQRPPPPGTIGGRGWSSQPRRCAVYCDAEQHEARRDAPAAMSRQRSSADLRSASERCCCWSVGQQGRADVTAAQQGRAAVFGACRNLSYRPV